MGTAIEGRYTEIGSLQSLAIDRKFLRRDLNVEDVRRPFLNRSEFSPVSNSQPHPVFAWKRCCHKYPENPVVLFSYESDIFDRHNSTSAAEPELERAASAPPARSSPWPPQERSATRFVAISGDNCDCQLIVY